jgi:hypothetical protein
MRNVTQNRLLIVVCAFVVVSVVCGCEKSEGNTPDTKKDTIAPTSSMESYKTGNPAGAAAKK